MKKIFTILSLALSTAAFSQVTVTYQVDITEYIAGGASLNANGIRIGGDFTTAGATIPDWTPSDAACAMTDLGSGLWSIAVTYPATSVGTTQLYKFVNGDWGTNEGLATSLIAEDGCGTDDGAGNINRVLVIPTTNTTVTFCWDKCAACISPIQETNVYDDVISTSPNHTTLKAALIQAGLVSALQDPTATLTVFAPDNAAFDALATALGVTATQLLANPELGAILTYHVLGQEVTAAAITNGQVVSTLNTTANGTIYLTKTSTGSVFADQANVTTPNLTTDNGIVHVVNKVLLPVKTVVDVAATNNFTTLLTAATQEELLPALTDPLATLTVFAPTNDAFTAIATALGTDINGLLAYPTLDEILKYHVLGSEVTAANVTNGAVVNTLSTVNTLKMTKTTSGSVYANHAMVTLADVDADNGVVHVINNVVLPVETVVDRAIDGGFSTLVTAVAKAELLPALTNPLATLTVFAPTNDAFDDLAAALDTDINGILALPNLSDVLKYHVLGSEVLAAAITNGQIASPLSTVNTLKLTKTTTGDVFINQAQVTTPNVDADNGVVHVINEVVLPVETVADKAIDAGFSTLVAAVVKAELLPTFSDPFDTLTVFAPTNAAFDDLAAALGTDINGILALPTLGEVLKYHVLGSEVLAAAITNGQIVAPLSTVNTLKLTKTTTGNVFINQAQVTTPNVDADNGVVHVINEVVLPVETVADKAIDAGFSTLVAAVVKAELLPALSNPYTELTVFAPTNAAFDALALALGTDLNGILALPNLADVLLYHVTEGNVVSGDLTNGSVEMLNGDDVVVDITNGVQINDANVTTANVEADNGVVHVIDAVLLPTNGLTETTSIVTVSTYPNPATETININNIENASFEIIDMLGSTVKAGTLNNNEINVESLTNGTYMIRLSDNTNTYQGRFIKR